MADEVSVAVRRTPWQVDPQQFEALLASIGEGLLTFTLDGSLLYANPAAHRLYHAASTMTSSQAWLEHEQQLPLQDSEGQWLEHHARPLQRLLAGHSFASLELQLHSPEQGWQVLGCSGYSIAPEMDKHPGITGTTAAQPAFAGFRVLLLRDLTATSDAEALRIRAHIERNAASYQYARAEERFQIAFESNPAPSLLLRLEDERIMAFNQGFIQLSECSEAQLQAQSLASLQLLDQTALWQQQLQHLRQQRRLLPCEVSLSVLRGNGARERRYALLAGKAINIAGQPCAILTFTDITERKHIEEELEAARLRLANMQERERLSLARELHDDAVQQLLALSYQLSQGKQRLQQRHGIDAIFVSNIENYRQAVLRVARQLRRLIRGLRPAGLKEMGLSVSLRDFVQELEHEQAQEKHRDMPHIHLAIDDSSPYLPKDDALAGQQALCLFRACQEALRNALNHAQAGHIYISLRFVDGCAQLEVRDDGQGFVLPESLSALSRDNHFGLVGTEEFVTALRGRFRVEAALGQGTRVQVWLPLRSL